MKILQKYLLFTFLFVVNATGFGQDVTISGKVIDDNNNALNGVTIKIKEIEGSYQTNERGLFSITVPGNETYTFRFSFQAKSVDRTFTVTTTNLTDRYIMIKQKTLGPVEVITYKGSDMLEKINLPEYGRISTPSQNFEDLIKVAGLGVTSNNELTASYNVRGGNYDENLIYVNGIQIYRPFLARSGQQEGLSFINPAFVSNIFFSPGGFDSYYGDKLSSVLDIRYREPRKFGGSAQISLMGGNVHVENNFAGNRGSFITGARYRSNSYLLNSLPTQGDYNPTFFDYQFLTNFYLDYDNPGQYKKVFALGHFSTNNYRFEPKTRTTSWGTVNEAYQLRVFYEGQEETKFQTVTGAVGVENMYNNKLKLSLVSSVFRSVESEHFDILAEYWINELETDPSKEDFGDSTSNVGVGGLLDHARNDLSVWIGNIYHDGKYTFTKKLDTTKNKTRTADLFWGAKVQYEAFNDNLSEWSMVDSAGYSIPGGAADVINLKEVIKQENNVESFRSTAYLQFSRGIVSYKSVHLDLKRKIKTDSGKSVIYLQDTIARSPAKLALTLGTRAGYRTFNDEYWVTPRASITYTPRAYFLSEDTTVLRRNMKIRLASGLYYQPPLYRTMRGIGGDINPDVVSQKSWHNVIGADVYFNLWGRPFKFVSEAYYKYMWDVVPYEIDNVRIRYYGDNNAVAYAYGFDAKVNGEFVKGVESFFRIGYLNTKEDILDDFYYSYINESGETIQPGITADNVAVDSTRIEPGFIPRPSDQRLTFSVFFQDKMPKFENLKVSANLIMGTPLPYGPPTYERYKDVLRTKSYLRLDLGFMYDIVNPENLDKYKDKKILKHFEQMTVSLDAFNLLGVNNIISYQWLQDIAGRYYAIPNHLTGRRINVRFIVKF